MSTPFQTIASKSQYIADLTNEKPELASVFMKAVQGIHMYVMNTRVNPSTIKYSMCSNADGLIISLNGSGRGSIGKEFYNKRMHDYGKVVTAVKGIVDILRAIVKFSFDHTQVIVKLSKSGNKLIISGERKYA